MCIYLLLVLVGEGEQRGDVEHELVLLVGGVHAADCDCRYAIKNIYSCNIICVYPPVSTGHVRPGVEAAAELGPVPQLHPVAQQRQELLEPLAAWQAER